MKITLDFPDSTKVITIVSQIREANDSTTTAAFHSLAKDKKTITMRPGEKFATYSLTESEG